jgi:hypothetical protein
MSLALVSLFALPGIRLIEPGADALRKGGFGLLGGDMMVKLGEGVRHCLNAGVNDLGRGAWKASSLRRASVGGSATRSTAPCAGKCHAESFGRPSVPREVKHWMAEPLCA